jgi:putative component of membrane protein insertase Oxa1/YidC/SpoIIIJ protein YidD
MNTGVCLAGKVRFLFLGLILSAMGFGCASSFAPERASGIDAAYRWSRTSGSAPGSPGVGFYREVLSRTLSSDCRYFPSDSEHAQGLVRRCENGPFPVVHAMARSIDEPNAGDLGYALVPIRGGLKYFRVKESCAWVE